MPVVKNHKTGGYTGILSSDGIDLDDEYIGEKLLRKWAENKVLAGLIDHKNSISSYFGGWKNFRLEKAGTETLLLADPVFFKSNPNTAFVQDMLKEAQELGLPFGISIGAMVTDATDEYIGNKAVRRWDDAKLLEASWVAVPANQTAGLMKSVKSLGLDGPLEESETKMDKEAKELQEKELKRLEEENKALSEKLAENEKLMAKFKEEEEKKYADLQKEFSEKADSLQKEFKEVKASTEKLLEEKVSEGLSKALADLEVKRNSKAVGSSDEIDMGALVNG